MGVDHSTTFSLYYIDGDTLTYESDGADDKAQNITNKYKKTTVTSDILSISSLSRGVIAIPLSTTGMHFSCVFTEENFYTADMYKVSTLLEENGDLYLINSHEGVKRELSSQRATGRTERVLRTPEGDDVFVSKKTLRSGDRVTLINGRKV